jgi:two-component system sensor histidine kinase BarA
MDHLNTIKKSANNLLSIIDDILDFSKIEAGKMELEKRQLNISDCVDEVLTLLGPAAQNKNIDLTGIINNDVPENLLGDPIRISQILTNLTNNAIKFTHKGNVQIRILLDQETPQSVSVKFEIQDTGIGLSKEQQRVLFHAFTQADTTTTRRFGGTGLGLVISKKLVESMDGRIGLLSKENEGSTFWFTIRLDKDPDEIKAEGFGFPGYRILLHDANEISQQATEHILNQWDSLVETNDDLSSITNRAKLNYEQNKDVHLILLGGYSSYEYRDSLLELQSIADKLGCPLAIMLNSSDEKIIKNYRLLGVKYFINKPIIRKNFYKTLFDWFGFDKQFKKVLLSQAETEIIDRDANILCVDDNEANLKLVAELLADYNIKVSLASNGKSAVEICKKNSFDLIFMDIQMPDIDGVEATKKIRKLKDGNKRIPIIALTAHAMKGEKEKLLKQGMDDYLTKPVSQDDLEKMIKKWSKRHLSRTNVDTKGSNSQTIEKESETINISSNQNNDIIDWQLSLKSANQREGLAKDMLTMLIASFKEAKQTISDTFDNQDRNELLQAVHKLHGATAYCGVPQLKQLAFEYETSLKQETPFDELENIHECFLKAIQDVEKAAKDYI